MILLVPHMALILQTKVFQLAVRQFCYFLLEIIRKDGAKILFHLFKIFFSPLIRHFSSLWFWSCCLFWYPGWGCKLSIFFRSMCGCMWYTRYLSQHVFVFYLFVDVICVHIRLLCVHRNGCVQYLWVYFCFHAHWSRPERCWDVFRGPGVRQLGLGELFVLACLLGMASLSVPIVQQITLPH